MNNRIKLYSKNQVTELKSNIDPNKYTSNNMPKLFDENDKVTLFTEVIEVSKKGGENQDINLAIAMDTNEFFQSLTDRVASQEELWVTLNLEYFSEYTYYRWLENEKKSENSIKERVFKSGKKLYNRNSMARLWWITSRTKDETLDDPYAYTRIILDRNQFEQSLMESTITKNPKLLKYILAGIIKYESMYGKISSKKNKSDDDNGIVEIMKHFNRIGGTYVLDIMDENYFWEQICYVMDKEPYPEEKRGLSSLSFIKNKKPSLKLSK